MTAATSDMPPQGAWTAADLDRTPEDGIRREIYDGEIHVTPSPSSIHQALSGFLFYVLSASCPEHLFVTQANDVVLSHDRTHIPDLLVVNFEAARSGTGKFAARDVVLAMEIVSPSTKSADRVTKPTYYAQAGIPFYWLIETSGGLAVEAYELNTETKAYESVGSFEGDDTIRLERPWPIEIPLSAVRPRNL
ncbi:Uma2 family endonuclease [Paractinoplanes lichenicola]|uniref:Uma2 family endonuclease n=1 Tax=Paractinoplanes lichenicola TaxID=2802976 RepID=A0ABS1VQV8_9ACTN|nr:Uma2 family endonuclease [Actinoplanes lichenicola]MBL7257111.1 Uma2 family endonuclease [Actinoplanes lichenicola]